MNKQRSEMRRWLTILFLLMPLSAYAENADVYPLEFDYGEVMVGSSMPMAFAIRSIGPYTPLTIYDITIVDNEGGYFDLDGVAPDDPLNVGEEIEVRVYFTPRVEGISSASLLVYSDAVNFPFLYVLLQGEGVVIAPTPSALMDYLLVYFNTGVANGTILGVGTGKRAEKRIDKFRKLLDTSDDLIAAGDDAGACEELNDAYLRIDGIARPTDYLVGPAVPTLSSLITMVMDSLDCP